jgi:hypothetical protein
MLRRTKSVGTRNIESCQGDRLGRARAWLPACLLAAALSLPGAALAGNGQTPASKPNPWTLCAKATNEIERREGIPRQLLRAISKVESGRLHQRKKVVMAWPWTVMAEGRGRYLATKAAAIAEVEALQARGVRNIDVGCMQVNLHYHPDAFADLNEAFDPAANVAYAAFFLKNLAAEQGSWAKAVARYHSANPSRYRNYRAKVHKAWRLEREKYLVALAELRATQGASEEPAESPAQATATESFRLELASLEFGGAAPDGFATEAPAASARAMAGPPAATVAAAAALPATTTARVLPFVALSAREPDETVAKALTVSPISAREPMEVGAAVVSIAAREPAADSAGQPPRSLRAARADPATVLTALSGAAAKPPGETAPDIRPSDWRSQPAATSFIGFLQAIPGPPGDEG